MKRWALLIRARVWQRKRHTCHRNGRKDCCAGQQDGLDEPCMSLPALGTQFYSATWRLSVSFMLSKIWTRSANLLAFQNSKPCRGKLICLGHRVTYVQWGRSKGESDHKAKTTLHHKRENMSMWKNVHLVLTILPGYGLETLTGIVLFALKTALWQNLVQGHRTQKSLMEQTQHE